LLAIPPCYAAAQHLQADDEKNAGANPGRTVHIARMLVATTLTAQTIGA
jgi:hypothetical protein